MITLAINKVSTSKSAKNSLKYVEREGAIITGVDCESDIDTACRQFQADRIRWNQEKGLQCWIDIQSFEGQEVTTANANRIGVALAKELFPNHRAVVATHVEKDNVHNHIIVCGVNYKIGKKIDTSWKMQRARDISDRLCKERGLSVVKEKAKLRYSMAEVGLSKKGVISWKDTIRDAVDDARNNVTSMKDFLNSLKEKGIEVSEKQRKSDGSRYWTYQKEVDGKPVKVRGNKLGANYDSEIVRASIAKNVLNSGLMRAKQIGETVRNEQLRDTAIRQSVRQGENLKITTGRELSEYEKMLLQERAERSFWKEVNGDRGRSR